MNWTRKFKEPREIECDYASANLSRFLDNDLSSKAATSIAAHLHGCLSCRQKFEGMRAQQAMFSSLSLPAGGRAARSRILHRLEASVAEKRPAPKYVAASARFSRLKIVSVGALALAAVAVVLVLMHLPRSASPNLAPVIGTAQPVVAQQLPASEAMAAMFAMHDRQSVVEAKPAAQSDRPKPRLARTRSRAHGRGRKAAPAMDERFARIASKAPADNLALGEGSHGARSAEYLASDDVPESL